MPRQQIADLVDAARVADNADRASVEAALVAINALVGWCEAQRLRCVTRLGELGEPAFEVIAGAGRITAREADAMVRRAAVSTVAPAFAGALADGQVGAGHLDELGRSLRRLSADQQQRLLARSNTLVAVAGGCNADDFARELRRHERSITRDDGVSVLHRQQASIRVRDWVDRDDGMHVWTLRVDPKPFSTTTNPTTPPPTPTNDNPSYAPTPSSNSSSTPPTRPLRAVPQRPEPTRRGAPPGRNRPKGRNEQADLAGQVGQR
jgi:hypothetical protein